MKITKHQTETRFDRDLDPYAEAGIFPGQWDLSQLPEQPESQEGGQAVCQEPGPASVEHGLAPGAMDEWHLAASFEEHLARHRRGWSAY